MTPIQKRLQISHKTISKWVYSEQDIKGRNLDLRFYRDKYKREVDFVVIENQKPILFIEAKYSQTEIAQGLSYLKAKFPQVRALQVHMPGRNEYVNNLGIKSIHVKTLLAELN